MENKMDISDKVLKIKSIIESKLDIWTLKEFQNFYQNIDVSKDINENEKELLAETCAKIIAERFPKRDSKKILGDKGVEGKAFIEEVFKILTKEFDWSNNDVGTRVKNGGDMISGRASVCYYISYKNKEMKINSGFHYRQKTVDSEPYLEVDFRKQNDDNNNSKTFPVALRDEALTLYRNYLTQIIK
jgi:hypothetical protein